MNEDVLSALTYQAIDEWGGAGCMQPLAAIEDAFDIMLDADDTIDLNSFEKDKEILRKYDAGIA